MSEPAMYQFGLKTLPYAPGCNPQTSFFQLSRSFSSVAVFRASNKSSDPRQYNIKGSLKERRGNWNQKPKFTEVRIKTYLDESIVTKLKGKPVKLLVQ